MPRYNLAYSPSDKIFSEACVAFAATHFGDMADGYCLNAVNAHPHVTLCQFTTDEAHLDLLWQKATQSCAESCAIIFDFVDLRPGTEIHSGFVWAELAARWEPGLIASQQNIARMLVGMDIEPLTQSGAAYYPHLTLARLKKVPQAGTPSWPNKAELKHPHTFHLTLGLANDNGVYLQRLRPS